MTCPSQGQCFVLELPHCLVGCFAIHCPVMCTPSAWHRQLDLNLRFIFSRSLVSMTYHTSTITPTASVIHRTYEAQRVIFLHGLHMSYAICSLFIVHTRPVYCV